MRVRSVVPERTPVRSGFGRHGARAGAITGWLRHRDGKSHQVVATIGWASPTGVTREAYGAQVHGKSAGIRLLAPLLDAGRCWTDRTAKDPHRDRTHTPLARQPRPTGTLGPSDGPWAPARIVIRNMAR